MPTCSSCGGNFDDTFQFCPYCGKPKPQGTIKVDVVSREPSSVLDCPKCHRIDSVSKVSAIVQGGTHEINGQVPVSYTSHDSEGWHSGTSYESYHATQQSMLASKLSPPEKPKREYSGLLGLAILPFLISPFVCLGAPMLPIAPLMEGKPLNGPILVYTLVVGTIVGFGIILYCAFLVGVVLACIRSDKPFKVKHAVNIAAWENSVSKWRELYYCSRDDCVFIPGESVTHNISNLNDAIEWHRVKKSKSLI